MRYRITHSLLYPFAFGLPATVPFPVKFFTMSQVSIQDLVYRGRLSSRTKSLRIELSFCSFGLVWVRLRFIYFARSLHFVMNHVFDPTSKKFPIAPILFNSAKSVTSLWMSSCIPNNPSTRLWLLIYFSRSLHFVMNHVFDPTSKKFPCRLGEKSYKNHFKWVPEGCRGWLLALLGRAFGSPWGPWGGLLGHLIVQRPPGQKQTPKVWKLAAPWGTQRNPKMTVFPWKPQRQVEFKEEITAQRILAKNMHF